MDGGLTMSRIPAHIIEEIRKRKREKEREQRPFLELPVPPPPPEQPKDEEKDQDKDSGGVVIIDLIIDQGNLWNIIEMKA
tara:strand:+ start:14015 stop:14254 length:240 start_codon:yes stop_codon:yes gene_type:complete